MLAIAVQHEVWKAKHFREHQIPYKEKQIKIDNSYYYKELSLLYVSFFSTCCMSQPEWKLHGDLVRQTNLVTVDVVPEENITVANVASH